MSVEVQFLGRLGNNLFQYAIGRIIAEELGYELFCHRLKPLPTASSALMPGGKAVLHEMTRSFPNAPLHIPGKSLAEPQERFCTEEHSTWSGQGIPFKSIIANKSDRRIVLRGYFQRIEYYGQFSERIRSWFTPNLDAELPRPDPDDVLVCIRRGPDYFSHGWVLTLQYYVDLLEKIAPGRVYVCGVGIDEQTRQALAPFSPVYFSGTALEDFVFISRFNRIILSNSTFSWWAGWLSDAEEIYIPRPHSYWGEAYPEVDLEVRENRYTVVEDVRMEVWRPFLRGAGHPIEWEDTDPGKRRIIVPAKGDVRIDIPSEIELAIDWVLRHEGEFGFSDVVQFVEPLEARETFRNVLLQLIKADAIQVLDEYLQRHLSIGD